MNDKDSDNTKIGNDDSYPNEYGALLVEPSPPKRGTFALLLPENFTWGAKRRNGAVRITFREITKTPVRREDVEGRKEVD